MAAGIAAQPQTGQLIAGLLPTRGINARDAFATMGPEDAVNLVNFLSDDQGLVLRGGYQEFAINLPGGVNVSTLMSYYPAQAGPSRARGTAPTSALKVNRLLLPRATVAILGHLLACTNGGIFEVTAGGPGPWTNLCPVVMPSDFWSWINFQSAAGNFLLTTNNLGGYLVYNGTGSFTKVASGTSPGQISGVNPDLLVYVMVWKRRVWLVEKESTRAWYLPIEQITGVATVFDMGSHFRHGGRLVSLFNWTLDGGEGVDDYLVAISDQGDVVIFKGYDPDSAASDPNAFQLHGIWYVGAVPVGHRQVTLYGGDVYILSVYGITQLSKLIGASATAANLIEDISSRIDPYIATLMEGDTSEQGWYIQFLPHEQMMIVGVPQQLTGEGLLQLGMKIRRGAWSKLLDLPLATMVNHDSLEFGGGAQSTLVNGGGKVYLLFTNSLDNVPLTEPKGTAIRGRIVASFSAFGTPGQWKIFPMVRPIIRTPATPSIKVQVLTDFTDSTLFNVPTLPFFDIALWDVDLWDQALWSGFRAPIRKWFGTTGCGLSATAQIDLVGLGGTSVMAVDWWVGPGGAL